MLDYDLMKDIQHNIEDMELKSITFPFISNDFDINDYSRKYKTYEFTNWENFRNEIDKTYNLIIINVNDISNLENIMSEASKVVDEIRAYRRGFLLLK
eukprot:UN23544